MTSADLLPWMDFEFSRSGGPGGQNVNKVSTRAILLFDFESCPLLGEPVKARIRRRLTTRLSSDGRLRIVSQKERTQGRNRAAAQARLLELLAEMMHVAPPRRPTRPSQASRRRRLEAKARRARALETRRAPRREP